MEMEETDIKILKQVFKENREGFQRLADEKPAEERRNLFKKFQTKIKDVYRYFTSNKEEKIGYITI